MSDRMFSSFEVLASISKKEEYKEIVKATWSMVRDVKQSNGNDLIVDFSNIVGGNYACCNTIANMVARLVNDAYNKGRKDVGLEIMESLVSCEETIDWLEKR